MSFTIATQEVARLTVQHDYYSDGICNDLALRPTEATAATLDSLGLFCQATPGRLLILNERGAGNPALRQREVLDLFFEIHVRNERFFRVTNPSGHARALFQHWSGKRFGSKAETATPALLLGRNNTNGLVDIIRPYDGAAALQVAAVLRMRVSMATVAQSPQQQLLQFSSGGTFSFHILDTRTKGSYTLPFAAHYDRDPDLKVSMVQKTKGSKLLTTYEAALLNRFQPRNDLWEITIDVPGFQEPANPGFGRLKLADGNRDFYDMNIPLNAVNPYELTYMRPGYKLFPVRA